MTEESVRTLVEPYILATGGLIQALRRLMNEFGYIDPEHIPVVAEVFNISKAEVRGVISFYHDFRTHLPARTRIRVCQAEACQALGARKLTQEIESHFNLKLGNMSDDRSIELDPVYCLGLCSVGPSLQVNDRLIARGSIDSIEGIGK
ncbi:MAG: NADH-quinone oxidoreductase subunit E [Gammaproteobacteria bacterium]|nr:NADH-quinone oxidoreductase subunit E [Gammaproteobacteria bacterium]MYD81472.1 NADH-quinone oxidoreductase subunit E [Gammaproteobacteria bacterium]